MSEEQTDPETTDEIAEIFDEDTTSTETDWKRESRKWESRAKAAQSDKEAADKWREHETNQKPLDERRAEELILAKQDADAAKLQLTRYEIASEKGVPKNAIKLLSGTTREELELAADELLELIAETAKSKTPKPVADQGKSTNSGVTTGDQFANAIGNYL